MKIEELREIFSENGLYAVRVEKGNVVSRSCIQCLINKQMKNGAVLIYFVDGQMTDGTILRDDEFVTSLRALKEISIKAGFSSFSDE